MIPTAELVATAAHVTPLPGHVLVAVVDVAEGGRLRNGTPSGVGVTTRYGVTWFDGLRRRPGSIAWFDRGRDAYRLIEILTGSTPRTASPSGAPASTAAGPAVLVEAVPGAVPGPEESCARAPGLDRKSEPKRKQPSTAAMPVVEARRAIQDPPVRRCKACGRSLDELPPSPTRQVRQTCDDSCRQAFRRGHRAPLVGVVARAELARLARIPRPPRRARPDHVAVGA